jgi:hypothetical protein
LNKLNETQLLARLGILLGILLGGYIPTFWGAPWFSLAGVMGMLVGGLLGIWLANKITQPH